MIVGNTKIMEELDGIIVLRIYVHNGVTITEHPNQRKIFKQK